MKAILQPSITSPSPPTTAGLSAASISRAPTTPTIVVHSAITSSTPNNDASRPSTAHAHGESNQFLRLTTPIPTGSLDDLLSPERMKFSNRGSIIMEGGWDRIRRAGENGNLASPSKSIQTNGSSRVLSADEASLSAKVRNMYEFGGEEDHLADQTLMEEEEDEDREALNTQAQEASQSYMGGAPSSRSLNSDKVNSNTSSIDRTRLHLRPTNSRLSNRSDSGIQRTPYEAAGGIEDWEDIQGDEIDRYGFITARATGSRGSHTSGGTYESGGPIQRVTTSLLEASNTPRKRNTMLRRMPSRASARSIGGAATDGGPSRQHSRRSLKPGGAGGARSSSGSVYGHRVSRSISNSQASLKSHLSSKERRLLVEAGDMLTLPPRLADTASTDAVRPVMTQAMRQKEWEREGKWKKMGRMRPGSSKTGGGMQFDFDPRDPKVISRTWKGIPDRWRATAWYSFLEVSAKKKKDSPGEDLLIVTFHELQHENSADDVQIDCDVPRTINRHIMFRRRYRGGQRLLFRVLHALSLYFPEIGYVQGMAALAATLLCYYDEEHAFIMMVRLWQLRGLQRLYESGFEGLMDALAEFEKHWLSDGAVAKKLVRFPTQYKHS